MSADPGEEYLDPLVELVADECPTCGAYMLNPALHGDWHRGLSGRLSDIADQAARYKPPPTYASATFTQTAPDPVELRELVEGMTYRPGWTFQLADFDRGQGSEGLTLDVVTKGYDSYHPERGEWYRVHHYFPVPPAAYNRQSWRRWLFECLLLVERHEACEFFKIDGERPYAPNHGPGWDPYIVTELTTNEDRRTSFRGVVKEPGE